MTIPASKIFNKIYFYENGIARDIISKVVNTGFKPKTKEELQFAVDLWCIHNGRFGTADYGHISFWDTSQITDMINLFRCICTTVKCFCGKQDFDADLTNWNVDNVKEHYNMFCGCSDIKEQNKPIFVE